MESAWIELPFWEEWGAITRIHGSAMIAFDHSKQVLMNTASAETELVHSESGSSFKALLVDHLARIANGEDLHKMALLRYYGAFETFTRFADYIISSGDFALVRRPLVVDEIEAIESLQLKGGVEAWTDMIIKQLRQNWSDVYGGMAGLVEVSLMRNAIAHGVRQMNQNMLDSAIARRTTLPFQTGQAITISFELLNEYRGRLRSYCRVLSDGLVHIAKDTHRDGRIP
jgi:hypothetical protein